MLCRRFAHEGWTLATRKMVRAACVRHESTKSPRSLSLGEKTAEIETKSGVTWYSCRASSCPLQLGGVWQRLLWLLWRRWACRRCDFCMHSATHELPRPFWVLQDWERAMQQTLLLHLPALARPALKNSPRCICTSAMPAQQTRRDLGDHGPLLRRKYTRMPSFVEAR